MRPKGIPARADFKWSATEELRLSLRSGFVWGYGHFAVFAAGAALGAGHRVSVLGTSPTAVTEYRGVRYPRPLLLLMGSERGGLSPADRALCDQLVRVPMVGRADSFNLAVATGVVLYELFYQQRAGAAREE